MANLKGWLEPIVLSCLEQHRLHGYGIATYLESGATVSVPSGSLYPVLKNLKQAGFIDAEWETEGSGPAKKVYSLTPDGAAALAEYRAQWLVTKETIDRLVLARSKVDESQAPQTRTTPRQSKVRS